MSDLLDEDLAFDDRRRTVNSGVRQGRAAEIANLRIIAGLGITKVEPFVIAIRGDRLALNHVRMSAGSGPETFWTEILCVVEVNADNRVRAVIVLDHDDFDAALAELDARYLAGEAAAHAQAWSVIATTFSALSRSEPPPTLRDWVNIDHRRASPFAPNDLTAVLSAAKDLTPDLASHVETVHLLNNCGALVTQVSHGTSREGFSAEWRMVNLLTVEGDVIDRCELFDEADLDTALAKFDELSTHRHRDWRTRQADFAGA